MSAAVADRLVALGAVTRPHGVRGELRVHRYNPASELLLELDRVWLLGPEPRAVRVLGARPHGAAVLMRLRGVCDREAAEKLRGVELGVPRDALPEPGEDEYYHVDLLGLAAVDAEGRPIGVVSNVIQYPSTDCLEIAEADGVREVPLLAPWVAEVDVEAGRVVLQRIEEFELRAPPRKRS